MGSGGVALGGAVRAVARVPGALWPPAGASEVEGGPKAREMGRSPARTAQGGVPSAGISPAAGGDRFRVERAARPGADTKEGDCHLKKRAARILHPRVFALEGARPFDAAFARLLKD